MADKPAKEATERTNTTRCPERFTLLTHIVRTMSERKWKESKHWFRTENDRRPPLQQARYDPTLECEGLDAAAMKEAAYVMRRYIQLKIGHTVTGTYLYLIGKVNTDRYWECTSEARIKAHHTMFDSRKWREERSKMQRRCKKDGGGQHRTLRQLMGPRKATLEVLGIIAATRVGQRTKKQKQEKEQ